MANVNISIALQGMAQVNGSIRALQSSLTRLGPAGRQTASDLSLIAAPLSAIFAMMAAGRMVSGILSTADAFTSLSARLQIVSKSASEHAVHMKAVFDIAQDARVPLDAVGKTYTRLAISTERLGLSQQQLVSVTSTLAKAQILAGATAEEAAGGMTQLTQAMSKGKLDGDELRSVFENMPLVVKAMEEATGRSRGELYKLAAQGKITAQVLLGSVLKAEQSVADAFNKMPRTISQAATQLANAWEKMIGQANAGQGAVGGFSQAMDNLRRLLTDPRFAAAMANFLGFLGTVAAKAASAFEEAFGNENVRHNLEATVNGLQSQRDELVKNAELYRTWSGELSPAYIARLKELDEELKSPTERLAAMNRRMREQAQAVLDFKRLEAIRRPVTTGGAKFDPGIPEAIDKEAASRARNLKVMGLENQALQASINGHSAEARAIALQVKIEQGAYNEKTGAIDEAVAAKIRENDALTRTASIVDSLRGPYDVYKDTMEEIAELHAANKLTAEQMGEAQMNAAQAYVQGWTGVGKALDELQSVSQNVFGSFTETLASALTDGKSSWADFFKDLQKQMIKFLISQAVMGLLKLIFTIATGGVGGGLMGLVSGFLGFASGGKVGISKGESNNMIGMINMGDGTFSDAALGMKPVQGFAKGGMVGGATTGLNPNDDRLGDLGGKVPGKGKTDSVRALLTPGEYVINAVSASKNLKTLEAINASKGVASLTALKKSLDTDIKSDAQASSIQKMYDALPKKTQKKMRGVSNFSTFLGFASGGGVRGVGHRDTIPAMLTPGEFVINKKATRRHSELLHEINSNRMAAGGVVGGGKPTWSRGGDSGGTTIVFSGITAIDEIGVARLERRLSKRTARADYRRYGITS